MKDRIEAFLKDLDESLRPHAHGETLDIYHIGRSSLVWKYDYPVTTTDIDILRPSADTRLLTLALQLFGKDSAKAQEHGLFLEPVDQGLPPVPADFAKRATAATGGWQVLRIYHLEPHDFAATKLKRFSARDRQDIRLLCDLDYLDPQLLEKSLEKAFLWSMPKDEDPSRKRAFQNLRIVQSYLRAEISDF